MTLLPASDDDDATLVARCRRGDQAAWAALVRRYQSLVHTIVRRVGMDDHAAADVFQTVFSRLITHLARISEPDRLHAWIVTTAKREALLQRSRGQRQVSMTRHDEDGEPDAPAWDPADDALLPDEALDALQQSARVRRALERLDERCRTLLTLLFDDSDDRPAYDEVARRTGMPVGSIGPTRSRCLGKLRQLIV